MKPQNHRPRRAQPGSQLISRRQLANRWECTVWKLIKDEAAGKLTPLRFNGRFVRYRLSDIQQIEREAEESAV